jgi:hypothetical protein
LLTASTTFRTPSSDSKNPCRRVSADTPLPASMTITLTSAVDAPVSRSRVWRISADVSATMKSRTALAAPRRATSALLPSPAPPHVLTRRRLLVARRGLSASMDPTERSHPSPGPSN